MVWDAGLARVAKSAGVVRVIVGDESGQRGGASQGSG